MHKSMGFTIIEFLVILSILTILTSILLTNVLAYKIKSRDSAIKQNIGSILLNGSIYFEKYGTYNPSGPGDFCNDPVTVNIFNSIAVNPADKECNANSVQWRVCAKLNIPSTGTLKAWCADNTGAKKEINNSQCNGSSAPCP